MPYLVPSAPVTHLTSLQQSFLVRMKERFAAAQPHAPLSLRRELVRWIVRERLETESGLVAIAQKVGLALATVKNWLDLLRLEFDPSTAGHHAGKSATPTSSLPRMFTARRPQEMSLADLFAVGKSSTAARPTASPFTEQGVQRSTPSTPSTVSTPTRGEGSTIASLFGSPSRPSDERGPQATARVAVVTPGSSTSQPHSTSAPSPKHGTQPRTQHGTQNSAQHSTQKSTQSGSKAALKISAKGIAKSSVKDGVTKSDGSGGSHGESLLTLVPLTPAERRRLVLARADIAAAGVEDCSPETRQTIVYLVALGCSIDTVSQLVGMAAETIRQWVKTPKAVAPRKGARSMLSLGQRNLTQLTSLEKEKLQAAKADIATVGSRACSRETRETLIQLVESGCRASKLAKRVGIHEVTLQNWVSHYRKTGLITEPRESQTWLPEEEAQLQAAKAEIAKVDSRGISRQTREILIQLVESGHPRSHVSHYVGLSPATLDYWVKEYRKKGTIVGGQPSRLLSADDKAKLQAAQADIATVGTRACSRETRATLIHLMESGCRASDLAKLTGVNECTLYGWLSHYRKTGTLIEPKESLVWSPEEEAQLQAVKAEIEEGGAQGISSQTRVMLVQLVDASGGRCAEVSRLVGMPAQRLRSWLYRYRKTGKITDPNRFRPLGADDKAKLQAVRAEMVAVGVKRVSRQNREMLIQLVESGCSAAEIARFVGMKCDTLYEWLSQYRKTGKIVGSKDSRPLSADTEAKLQTIKAEIATGGVKAISRQTRETLSHWVVSKVVSVHELSKLVGMSKHTLRGWVKAYRKKGIIVGEQRNRSFGAKEEATRQGGIAEMIAVEAQDVARQATDETAQLCLPLMPDEVSAEEVTSNEITRTAVAQKEGSQKAVSPAEHPLDEATLQAVRTEIATVGVRACSLETRTTLVQWLLAGRVSIQRLSRLVGIPSGTLKGWLDRYRKRGKIPEPQQGGRLSPEEEAKRQAVKAEIAAVGLKAASRETREMIMQWVESGYPATTVAQWVGMNYGTLRSWLAHYRHTGKVVESQQYCLVSPEDEAKIAAAKAEITAVGATTASLETRETLVRLVESGYRPGALADLVGMKSGTLLSWVSFYRETGKIPQPKHAVPVSGEEAARLEAARAEITAVGAKACSLKTRKTLIELVAAGRSTTAIAQFVGIPPSMLGGWLCQYRKTGSIVAPRQSPRLTPEEEETLTAAKTEMATVGAQKCSREARATLVAMVDAGGNIPTIAAFVGISPGTLRYWVAQHRQAEQKAQTQAENKAENKAENPGEQPAEKVKGKGAEVGNTLPWSAEEEAKLAAAKAEIAAVGARATSRKTRETLVRLAEANHRVRPVAEFVGLPVGTLKGWLAHYRKTGQVPEATPVRLTLSLEETAQLAAARADIAAVGRQAASRQTRETLVGLAEAGHRLGLLAAWVGLPVGTLKSWTFHYRQTGQVPEPRQQGLLRPEDEVKLAAAKAEIDKVGVKHCSRATRQTLVDLVESGYRVRGLAERVGMAYDTLHGWVSHYRQTGDILESRSPYQESPETEAKLAAARAEMAHGGVAGLSRQTREMLMVLLTSGAVTRIRIHEIVGVPKGTLRQWEAHYRQRGHITAPQQARSLHTLGADDKEKFALACAEIAAVGYQGCSRETRKGLIDLVASGCSLSALAARVGMPVDTLGQWVHQYRKTGHIVAPSRPPRVPLTPAIEAKLAAAKAEIAKVGALGTSYPTRQTLVDVVVSGYGNSEQISQLVGLSASALYQWVRQYRETGRVEEPRLARPLTPEEEARLAGARAEIAQVGVKRCSPASREAAIQVVEQGKSVRIVGKFLGVGEETVRHWVQTYRDTGLIVKPSLPCPLNDDDKAQLQKVKADMAAVGPLACSLSTRETLVTLVEAGRRIHDISEFVGIKDGTLRGWVKHFRKTGRIAAPRQDSRQALAAEDETRLTAVSKESAAAGHQDDSRDTREADRPRVTPSVPDRVPAPVPVRVLLTPALEEKLAAAKAEIALVGAKGCSREAREAAIQAVEEGETVRAVAKFLGVGERTVSHWVQYYRETGLIPEPAPSHPLSETDKAQLAAARADIAAVGPLSCSPQTRQTIVRIVESGGDIVTVAALVGVEPATIDGWVEKAHEGQSAGPVAFPHRPHLTEKERTLLKATLDERLGTGIHACTRATRELVIQLAEAGRETKGLSAVVGASPTMIRHWVRKYQRTGALVTSYPTTLLPEDKVLLEAVRTEVAAVGARSCSRESRETIIHLVESGKNMSELSQYLGLSLETVRRWVNRYRETGQVAEPRLSPERHLTSEDKVTLAAAKADVAAVGVMGSSRKTRRTIVLLAEAGRGAVDIGQFVGVPADTILDWVHQYRETGLIAGLTDEDEVKLTAARAEIDAVGVAACSRATRQVLVQLVVAGRRLHHVSHFVGMVPETLSGWVKTYQKTGNIVEPSQPGQLSAEDKAILQAAKAEITAMGTRGCTRETREKVIHLMESKGVHSGVMSQLIGASKRALCQWRHEYRKTGKITESNQPRPWSPEEKAQLATARSEIIAVGAKGCSLETRIAMVRWVVAGRISATKLSKALRISPTTLYLWVRRYGGKVGGKVGGNGSLTSDEKAQLDRKTGTIAMPKPVSQLSPEDEAELAAAKAEMTAVGVKACSLQSRTAIVQLVESGCRASAVAQFVGMPDTMLSGWLFEYRHTGKVPAPRQAYPWSPEDEATLAAAKAEMTAVGATGLSRETREAILQLALKSGQGNQISQIIGVSRKTFSRWMREYQETEGVTASREPRTWKPEDEVKLKAVQAEIADVGVKKCSRETRETIVALVKSGYRIADISQRTGVFPAMIGLWIKKYSAQDNGETSD